DESFSSIANLIKNDPEIDFMEIFKAHRERKEKIHTQEHKLILKYCLLHYQLL
ncbi:unnamed protein product, partial [marine sediment metagenome]